MKVRPSEDIALGWDALPGLFPEFGGAPRWLALLQEHARIIEAAEPAVRVSSVTPTEAVRRHYAESLELLRLGLHLGADPRRIADVGSGGGFPGLVIAALLPQSDVHLVEPLRKRAHLLEEAADAMGLRNVTVYAQRAEDAGRGPLRDGATLVIARALAEMRALLEYTAPFAAAGALIVLPKGSAGEGEVTAAANAAAALGCIPAGAVPMRPEISAHLVIRAYRKQGPTPTRYPRRPGVPGKRPL